MLGAAGDLTRAFGAIEIDAKVSRRLKAATDILRGYHDAGKLGDTVITHIGTNGPIDAPQFDDLMQVLTGVHKVVIVNVKVPRWWQDQNNLALADGVRRYTNTVLVDWYAMSHNRRELFRRDGFHLRPDGTRFYADVIAQRVADQQPLTAAAHASP